MEVSDDNWQSAKAEGARELTEVYGEDESELGYEDNQREVGTFICVSFDSDLNFFERAESAPAGRQRRQPHRHSGWRRYEGGIHAAVPPGGGREAARHLILGHPGVREDPAV